MILVLILIDMVMSLRVLLDYTSGQCSFHIVVLNQLSKYT